jgi:hypothetical protein
MTETASQLAIVGDDDLRAITTAAAVLADADAVVNVQEFGTGFVVLENKDALVDAPFVIVKGAFYLSETYDGRNGEDAFFVSLHVVDEKGNKWILNDGSTGIADQYRVIAREKGYNVSTITHNLPGPGTPKNPIAVPRGLSKSEYDTTIDGRKVHGITYYFDGM